MTTPPLLTDRTALSRNRTRSGRDPVTFLHDALIDEVKERLELVNKSFTKVAIVTGMPGPWQAAFPDARIIADDDILALDPGTHDLVIHALALHWANDPVGQLVQCRHALEPDGLMIAALFGGQTLHELRAALAEAESRATGGLSPRIAPMGEIRDLGGLLQRAGFALPVADALPYDVTYASALHLMRDLRGMGETNALAGRLRSPTRRAVMFGAVETYARHFGTDDGRVPATFEVVVLTGWAPDPSQQKPLRPGSAAQRLADALGATETPLSDSKD
ncbi:SAM-dependent methyltransferase [Loktanella sp. IMCC34160]|uniref:SAM-dependent methyltransferase n=1 Tax=Loktanella sp. IMCC34160 TaxID=2510646 RepID=UPI00101D8C9D|nr:SAM-dependent methyltransferase [Loktanella sp. IMCC34160]RYG91357.1 SAM-dependent methyltransferase [Loktanella sp. IMCC34160]